MGAGFPSQIAVINGADGLLRRDLLELAARTVFKERVMPIVNRIAELLPEISAWRQDIHAHPELLFDVHRTAGVVAEKLKSFGCDEVVSGIGRTGVVGLIRGKRAEGSRVIGLRADMDALPITEETGLSYASKTPG